MASLSQLVERAVQAVERAGVLDRPSDLGQRVTGKLGPGPVKDALYGTAAGHPIHPALVALPIGTLSAATFFESIGDRRTAQRLTAFGVISAAPGVLAGLSDWNETQGAERRVGAAHAIANTAALGLYAAAAVTERPVLRRALSLGGAGVLSLGGWLGGHLAYALGVGVDTTAFQKPPTEWTDACAEDVLQDGKPIAVTVEDTPLLIVRQGHQIHAIGDRCTHRGAPLHEGPIEGTCVECPWHGSRFDLRDGSVVRGPATRPQPAFDVRVVAGRVEVRREELRALRLNPTS